MTTLPKRGRGRPKRKPDYDKDQHVQDLIQQAVELFRYPYDDREKRPADAPTVSSVAEEMHTTRIRIRKMLITAGYFSSALSRKICVLAQSGASIQDICAATGLKEAAVNSYLPYERGVYNLSELSVNAELCKQFQLRRRSYQRLQDCLNNCLNDALNNASTTCLDGSLGTGECTCANSKEITDALWNAILTFENYPFQRNKGDRFRYRISGETLHFEEQAFSRQEIEDAFWKMRGCSRAEGSVDNSLVCKDLLIIFRKLGCVD